MDPQDLPERFEDSGLIESIKTFVQVHRNSFLLLYAPFNGKKELEMLHVIQSRYMSRPLCYIFNLVFFDWHRLCDLYF